MWEIADTRMRIDPAFAPLLQSARDSGLDVQKTFLCAITVLKARNEMISGTDFTKVRRSTRGAGHSPSRVPTVAH